MEIYLKDLKENEELKNKRLEDQKRFLEKKKEINSILHEYIKILNQSNICFINELGVKDDFKRRY